MRVRNIFNYLQLLFGFLEIAHVTSCYWLCSLIYFELSHAKIKTVCSLFDTNITQGWEQHRDRDSWDALWDRDSWDALWDRAYSAKTACSVQVAASWDALWDFMKPISISIFKQKMFSILGMKAIIPHLYFELSWTLKKHFWFSILQLFRVVLLCYLVHDADCCTCFAWYMRLIAVPVLPGTWGWLL